MDIKIFTAAPEDSEQILALQQENKQYIRFINRLLLDKNLNLGNVLIAEDSNTGEFVGFINFYRRLDRVCVIYHLLVKDGFKGQGIGKALLNEATLMSPHAYSQLIRVIFPYHQEALPFIRVMGFEETSIEKRRRLTVYNYTRKINGHY